MKPTIIVYFIRRSLSSHVGINLAWVKQLNEYHQAILFTTIPLSEYFNNRSSLRNLQQENKNLYYVPAPKSLDYIITLFVFLCLSFKWQLIIHFKKRKPGRYKLLKLVSDTKFLLDLEGDPEAEVRYLEEKLASGKHPEYKKNIDQLHKDIPQIKKSIEICDVVLLSSPEFKKKLTAEYPQKKILSVPTGFDHKIFRVNYNTRKVLRAHLRVSDNEKLLVYSGNIYYSWQNFSKTCRLVAALQNKFPDKYKFMALVRADDLTLARSIILKYGVSGKKNKNVPFSDVAKHLNACDCGILLRDNHDLNRHASPGKVGEYLSSGLPVIITSYIGIYSNTLKNKNFSYFIDVNQGSKISKLLEINRFLDCSFNREEINQFAKSQYSVSANVKHYIKSLK